MPSRRLDPVAQWEATARLAVEWERQARRIIARFPTLEAPWDQWHAAFEGIASELAPTTRRKSIKNYLDMLSGIGQF